jgi:transposase
MPATTTGAPAADASGVGPVTALATEVFLGDASRFAGSNQVASYIGMIPCEHTSGKRQRLGKMTKEGNSLLRYLWTEATLHAVSGEEGPGAETLLWAQAHPKRHGQSEDRSGAQTGNPAMDHAARPD